MRECLAIAIIALFYLSPLAAQDAAKPKAITVVKTWNDLQDVPTIELEGGCKIRLGIEAAKSPRWSGILLYCLAEGYEPPKDGKYDHVPFGPVCADFAFDRELPVKSQMVRISVDVDSREWKNRSCLFVRGLAID